ncbi:hypothetical protein P43SY_003126 [Pythium insidiosum]|uniref:DNA polymerase n=1 Tax=Pythium insidiosum TaxID=114742 RepID=A0AAD5QEG7_PYTIN|nr:hypothetical protein P43SY_003126 [Pythium insidiosum]
MDARKICLHPYRKRKFFHGLAELLHQAPATIRRIEDVFPGGVTSPATEADNPVTSVRQELRAADGAEKVSGGSDELQCVVAETEPSVSRASGVAPLDHSTAIKLDDVPSQQLHPEDEDESFEYVEFDRSRASLDNSITSLRHGRGSQGSMQHDSIQDSLLFLPAELHADASPTKPVTPSPAVSTTTLRAGPPLATLRQLELLDYFDLDRYTEITPCWAFPEDTTACTLHREPPRRPMLLFCLQALDEFIARQSSRLGDASWITESCRVARTAFAIMWEADVLGTSAEPDISLPHTDRQQLRGVSSVVWRVLDECWLLHRAQFLHQQELFFPDSGDHVQSRDASRWTSMRELLHVFGLKPSQAARVIDDMDAQLQPHDLLSAPAATLEAICRGYPSAVPLSVGIALLQATHATTSPTARLHRHVIGQADWKIAFRALELHVHAWSDAVDIFPCGAFARGAAFGSVLDVLIALPEDHAAPGPQSRNNIEDESESEGLVDTMLAVLQRAGIVDAQRVSRLSAHRALAIIRFKTAWLALDLKVYSRPQSWFALLYFTGPERFARDHFELLAKRPLTELREATFDCIFPAVVRSVGRDAVGAVANEKDVFELADREYLPPSQRF